MQERISHGTYSWCFSLMKSLLSLKQMLIKEKGKKDPPHSRKNQHNNNFHHPTSCELSEPFLSFPSVELLCTGSCRCFKLRTTDIFCCFSIIRASHWFLIWSYGTGAVETGEPATCRAVSMTCQQYSSLISYPCWKLIWNASRSNLREHLVVSVGYLT